ncbi:SDR family oxidoreductase [Sphingomonas sp. QA11]|uniref:NAD-dependent epimerase/dehydratase family protein n=1 Tax=Sphingomonas sp. QA11 TaxID=2950605 RepID=UPI002349EBCF|nr:NAD(P)H-binding protein [Sphingomonas sp. QA11]WCM25969.1 SDR family oxidoreductase [Sphingomonas sp. QA11]
MMSGTVFVAGATGAIGRCLIPILVADGWRVVGTTRSPEKAGLVSALGAVPAIVDVFDAEALATAVVAAAPAIVIHQLTDLPAGLDPAKMADATARNARIRDEGTCNLVAAAARAGVSRLVAQSVAFAYAEGPLPHGEDAPLAIDAEGRAGVSARGVASLERQVMDGPFEGIVLRYGRLYGPHTGFDAPAGPAPVHVDAAAKAAALAVTRGASGLYNVAEEDGTVSSERVRQAFGWSADWRARSGV